jgi:TOMM system kinase/cyclase fusion protein
MAGHGLVGAPARDWGSLIGQVFGGRYRLDQVLGRGGFGVVFSGRQLQTGQRVAIKVMAAVAGTGRASIERQAARFRREMQVCANLNHPHIVQLIDSGEAPDQLLYTVFELVPGETLSNRIYRDGALSPLESLPLMGQVLDALAAAHSVGIVHRDLKPQNIMLVQTGARLHVKVLDFGVAAAIRGLGGMEVEAVTVGREALGTPAYSAPEQLRGDPPTVRSDLYSWGLVFLELLTGRPAMVGTSLAEIIHRQLQPDPVRLPGSLAQHPLGDLLARVLEKDPTRRFGSATQVLAALEAISLRDLPGSGGQPLPSNVPGGLPVATADDATTDVGSLTANEVFPAGTPATDPITGGARGERRQVTLLSCSLGAPRVEGQDPEVVDELIQSHQQELAETIDRHGGLVLGTLGDRTLAAFGLPNASELDTRRAARAALDLLGLARRRRQVLAAQGQVSLNLRAGLHAGLVVVRGGKVSPGLLQHEVSRLESLAPEGEIITSPVVRSLLDGRLEFQSGPDFQIGNQTVPTWSLVGEALAEALSWTPSGTSAERAILGRSGEITQLQQAWSGANEGLGRGLLVVGEAGIGKSRLAREIRRIAAADKGVVWEWRCEPELMGSDLGPVLRSLRAVLGLPVAGGSVIHLAQRLVEMGLSARDLAPLLGGLLRLDGSERFPAPNLPPARLRELQLDAVRELLFGVAESSPLGVLVEDLHWADPTTLSLLASLSASIAESRVLLLATSRPTTDPYSNLQNIAILPLNRLPSEAMRGLVEQVAGAPVPDALLQKVAERSDGVPLFAEELTRVALESGALTLEEGAWRLVRALDDRVVPAGLRSSLTARLESLGRARETAEIAAAIGREFGHALLSEVSMRDEAAMQADLEQMLQAGLIVRRRSLREPGYLFRHALIRDTAYDTLVRESRVAVHGRIAAALQRSFAERVESQPELVAQHLSAAEDYPAALQWYQRAALGSLLRSANLECIQHGETAIAITHRLGPIEGAGWELGFLALQIPALMATRGWADEALKSRVDRALAILDKQADHPAGFSVRWAATLFYHLRGVYRRFSLDRAEDLLASSARSGDSGQRITGLACRGHCRWIDGDYAGMSEDWNAFEREYDPASHGPLMWTLGHDMRVWSQICHAVAMCAMGKVEQANALSAEIRAMADGLKHPSSQGLAILFSALIAHDRGDRPEVVRLTDSLLELARQFGLPAHIAYGGVMRSWAMGDPDHGLLCLSMLEMGGHMLGITYYRGVVAEGLSESGRVEEALSLVESAIEFSEKHGERWYLPALLVQRGDLWARLGRPASDQESAYQQGFALASAGGLGLFGARAAGGLAKLARSVGDLRGAERWIQQGEAMLPDGPTTPGTGAFLTERAALRELADPSGELT